MRKLLTILGALLISTQAFATYFVVLKDGTQYRARAKWTLSGGKAIIQLEGGSTLAIDPSSIDVAKSEETTKLGGGSVLAQEQAQAPAAQQKSTLGSAIKLRKLDQPAATTAPAAAPAPVIPTSGALSSDVLNNFERAYENVGIFEHKVIPTGAHSLRAELTADSEEKVFNAISATSFLMVRGAAVPGTQIDLVELFMKTTTGGSSGRFQMTRDDATALDGKAITREMYFVNKVLY